MTGIFFLTALLAGTAAPPAPPAPPVLDEAQARNAQNWQVLFSQYPPRALAARQEGQVGFRVKLDRDGWATECQVTKTSGFGLLDDETCRLIVNRATFKGLRDAHGRRVATVTEGLVDWKLNQAANAPAAAPASFRIVDAPPPASEKRVCKRYRKTGTLSGYERYCLTEKEWIRLRHENQVEWGDLQGTKGNTHGG
jgi:TonB family protein